MLDSGIPGGTARPATGAGAWVRPVVGELYQARARLRGVACRTPLHHSRWLSRAAGVPVHLKLECWQLTHSFKFRGAYNAVAALRESGRNPALVTASAGNHGQALALAADLHGAEATIFVPEDAPKAKQDRIRSFGGTLRPVHGTYDDAAVAARDHAVETGAHLVHGFDDPVVVAGQGTVGLEIVEDVPDLAEVVVPVGGGGLIAGVGLAVGTLGTGVRVVGVQSDRTGAMHAAFRAGAVVPTPVTPTLCDGLAGETEPGAFARAWQVTDVLHLVSEEAVAEAIRALYVHEGIVAEGSGAVGIAAVLEGLPLSGPAAIVVSGGNIDPHVLAPILAPG
jgi:threonine dehydratase